ncbi:MAG TPA: MFS transporter [Myxococcales bacterium]|nr:MFS transporter [Myxococcales bacterium]
MLDELAAGVAPTSAPDLLRELHLSPAQAAGWTLVVMQLSGVLLEAPLLALTARWPRRGLIAGSLVAVAVTCGAAALAPGYGALLGALFVFGLAIGMACSLAEAAVVDEAAAADRERVLARWSLLGALGDVASPLMIGGLSLCGLGWRSAFAGMALLALAYAALVRAGPPLVPAPAPEDEGEANGGGWRSPALRRAVLWCSAAAFCTLLDEVLVSFGSLRLEELGAAPGERSVVLAAGTLGCVAGLVASEWAWSRVEPLRLMMVTSLGCAVALAAWPSVHSLPLSAAVLAACCALAAPLFPVVQAQAFAALPGRSGTVGAIFAVVSGVELLVPLAVGAVADRWGLRSALASLLLGPLGLFAVAAATLGRRGRRPRAGSEGEGLEISP